MLLAVWLRLWRFLFLTVYGIGLSLLAAQEQRDGLRVGKAVVVLDKTDGAAAFLNRMVKPAAAANCDAVIAFHPLAPTGGEQRFSPAAQKFFQIHMGGPVFLLFGKGDIGLHPIHSFILKFYVLSNEIGVDRRHSCN